VDEEEDRMTCRGSDTSMTTPTISTSTRSSASALSLNRIGRYTAETHRFSQLSYVGLSFVAQGSALWLARVPFTQTVLHTGVQGSRVCGRGRESQTRDPERPGVECCLPELRGAVRRTAPRTGSGKKTRRTNRTVQPGAANYRPWLVHSAGEREHTCFQCHGVFVWRSERPADRADFVELLNAMEHVVVD